MFRMQALILTSDADFTSVNFNAALLRLNNIAQADIPQQAAQCFRSLQNHRNRLVHFSHPAYSSPASREAQEAVLAEQLRAWYYLHQLLQLRWYSEFSGVMPLISNLNQMMHRRADFLKIKFDELANHIEKLRREGALFASCPACGFESSGHLLQLGPLQVSRCLVCSHEVKAVAAHCPACHANNLLSEIEHKQCKMCKRDITLADLLAEHGTAAGDPDVESAYCHGCEYTADKNVVPVDKAFLCLNCFTPHVEIARCRWCDEVVTGEIGNYHNPGCVMCKHHIVEEMGG